MARDPGSVWAPLPEAGAPDGHRKDQFVVHSVGAARQAARQVRDNWFARPEVAVESTFIVGWGPHDPTLQVMDSTDRADANGSSNARAISVEVVGDGDGGYIPWQRDELIRLGRWAHRAHDIPLRICPSASSGGFGWHTLFGAPGPWTQVRGKTCPDGARDRLRSTQLRGVVFPAIFGGPALVDHSPAALQQEDDMPLTSADLDAVQQRFLNVLRAPEFRLSAPSIADAVAMRRQPSADGSQQEAWAIALDTQANARSSRAAALDDGAPLDIPAVVAAVRAGVLEDVTAGVRSAVAAELGPVDGVDEVAVADRVVDALAARLSGS